MSADIYEAFVPYCEECGWEGEPEEFRSDAERAVDRHDEEEHPDEDGEKDERSSWEIYQDELDEIVEAIVAR